MNLIQVAFIIIFCGDLSNCQTRDGTQGCKDGMVPCQLSNSKIRFEQCIPDEASRRYVQFMLIFNNC